MYGKVLLWLWWSSIQFIMQLSNPGVHSLNFLDRWSYYQQTIFVSFPYLYLIFTFIPTSLHLWLVPDFNGNDFNVPQLSRLLSILGNGYSLLAEFVQSYFPELISHIKVFFVCSFLLFCWFVLQGSIPIAIEMKKFIFYSTLYAWSFNRMFSITLNPTFISWI